MKSRLTETIGTISKGEELSSLEKNLSNKIMVLESKHPFPGYYRDIPLNSQNPRSVFLITKRRFDEELIIRTSLEISRETAIRFDGAPGRIEVYNIPAYCIRIKYLENIADIKTLIEAYQKKGILFQRYTPISSYYSVIKIQKFFDLEELSDGIYKNMRSKEFYYFEIPKSIDWDTFNSITQEIRHNVDGIQFDAALGTFYRKRKIIDMVRIYDSGCKIENLANLQLAYIKAIENL